MFGINLLLAVLAKERASFAGVDYLIDNSVGKRLFQKM